MMLQLIRVDKFITETQRIWDQIVKWDNEFSNVYIIYNNTRFPFISSDNSVIRKRVKKDDLNMFTS